MTDSRVAGSRGPVFGPEERHRWIHGHIAYRFQAASGLEWYCATVGGGLLDRLLSVRMGDFDLGPRTLTSAIVDAGLAHSRASIEFFGLTVKKGSDQLHAKTEGGRDDDVSIEAFGLPRVTPEDIRGETPPRFSGPEIEKALAYTYRVASKGVAHITHGSPPAELRSLETGAWAVCHLLRTRFFGPLGVEPSPWVHVCWYAYNIAKPPYRAVRATEDQ